jgi:ankyrin repeat protein
MKKLLLLLVGYASFSLGMFDCGYCHFGRPQTHQEKKENNKRFIADRRKALEALCDDPDATAEQLDTIQMIGNSIIEVLPLYEAACHPELADLVKKLLKRGANPNQSNACGEFPIEAVIVAKNHVALTYLLDYKVRTSIGSTGSWKALLCALGYDDPEMVRTLMDHPHSADPTIVNYALACYLDHLMGHGRADKYKKEILQELNNHNAVIDENNSYSQKIGALFQQKHPELMRYVRMNEKMNS